MHSGEDDMKRHREKMTIDGPRRQTTLVVQCFKLHASNAEVIGSIMECGTEIPHAARCGQRIKEINR